MTPEELFLALRTATTPAEVEAALDARRPPSTAWQPVGNRESNRGTIEAAADPGRSLVERLTNGIDAVLEYEHAAHTGVPECRSPKEAAAAWLGIPDGGLSELSQAERQRLAKRVSVSLLEGAARNKRMVEVADLGIGIAPEDMATTILSLNEGNKLTKHYLAGLYGRGGSSTFAVSDYTLIASRADEQGPVGFTVVKFLDLPPDLFRTGHYVYLTDHGMVLQAHVPAQQFPRGTIVRHIGYDLTSYPSPLGPNSLYGLLNTVLFDPTLPVWLDSRVHNYRRVIKGSRNALNGAVDEGDERRAGPTLAHNVREFFVNIGEFGRVGIEYWVLEAPTQANKAPSAAFVNPKKPIILTLNGQNQAELSQVLIRKHAELPYLTQRLICHIDCNYLTPLAKRALFVSNREDARRGMVYELVEREIVNTLRSDDELTRLNNEARERGLRAQDETATQQMRAEVARLLRLHGLNITEPLGAAPTADGTQPDVPSHPRQGRRLVAPLALNEPPTYIKLVWDDEHPIAFYPEQRRYLRIETDAQSSYHDANDPSRSRVNLILTGQDLRLVGTTPLQGGRMRAIVEALAGATIGAVGNIRIELSRQGLPTLADERAYNIEVRPPSQPASRRVSLPPFDVRPVGGPDDPMWTQLGWQDDISKVASSAEVEQGTLVVYYSTVFPKFTAKRQALEGREPALAESFTRRYEIWLAVHALLLHADQEAVAQGPELPEGEADGEQERAERVRMATISVLFAAREVESPAGIVESE
jgi:hypothetical protein